MLCLPKTMEITIGNNFIINGVKINCYLKRFKDQNQLSCKVIRIKSIFQAIDDVLEENK
jgi:hypothetical protein